MTCQTIETSITGRLNQLCVSPAASLREVLRVIEEGGEAIAFVCDASGRVIGTLTDGDVRRALLAGSSLDDHSVPSAMRRDFLSVPPDAGRAEVLDIMRARDIRQLPVLDSDKRLCGLHTLRALLSIRERANVAVILAGGLGTRLHPITQTMPKPMVKVAGRPILERLILHIMSAGIRHFYLAINYLADVIEEHFGTGERFGCRIDYLREQTPLGTGGPLSLLPSVPDLPVLVLNGDLVTQCNVGAMLDFHEANNFIATFGIKPYSLQVPFGVALVDDHRLVGLREKPNERMLINAGIYVLSPDALRLIPRNTPYPITDLFQRCLEDGLPVGAHMVEDEWIDVGRLDELRRARGDV